MSTLSKLFFLHAVTPVHIGVDQGLGDIDLPTMRAAHTGLPIIPGSSIKGVLRDEARTWAKSQPQDDTQRLTEITFGPPSERAGDFRGGVVFGDARLLALPVRSLRGTFAWVTSPLVLRGLRRDVSDVLQSTQGPPTPPEPPKNHHRGGKRPKKSRGKHRNANPRTTAQKPADASRLHALANALNPAFFSMLSVQGGQAALVARGSALLVDGQRVFVEELLVDASPSPEVNTLAECLAAVLGWQGNDKTVFRDRLMVVHDDVLLFLSQMSMDVRARVQLDPDTGTVKHGPWTEEHIPAECLLSGLVMGRPTQYIQRKQHPTTKDGTAAEDAASKDSAASEDVTAKKSLGLLITPTFSRRMLRLGGKASVGLGRVQWALGRE